MATVKPTITTVTRGKWEATQLNIRTLKKRLADLDERLKAVEQILKPKAKGMLDWLR